MNLQNEINVSQRLALIRVTLIACSALAIVAGALLFSTSFLHSFESLADESNTTITGTVYADMNKNGEFDNNESPLSNTRIILYADANSDHSIDHNDQIIQETRSNENGQYTFTLNSSYREDEQTVRVSSYSDDANEHEDGTIDLNDNDLHIGYRLAAVRFTGLSIPKGAQIIEAKIDLLAQDSKGGACKTRIFGEASDDAEEFIGEAHNISSRPKTNAFAEWQPDDWQQGDLNSTPSLTQIVQEIASRDEWKEGNSMVFMFTKLEGHRDAMTREEHMNKGPELFIRYSIGTAVQNLIVKIDKEQLRPGQKITSKELYPINNMQDDPTNSGNNFGIWKENIPTQWENVSAHRMVDNVELKWSTGKEDENAHFEVQKSFDAINWELLDEIMVRQNQAEKNDYSSFDYSEILETVHYRIKRVEADGSVSYSPTKTVRPEKIAKTLDVFPIPANDYITVRAGSTENVQVSIVSVSGQVIKNATIQDIYTFSTADLPGGVYFVQSAVNGNVQSKRVLIQH